MTTSDTSQDWYWGSLRSALGAQDLERAWALIAAWPADLEPVEAHRYVLGSAPDMGGPERVTGSAWMLEYYRALPVPMRLEPLSLQECDLYERQIPLYHPWEGQVLRFLEEGHELSGWTADHGPNSVVTEGGLTLALEAWFYRAPDGEPQVSLRGAVPREYGDEFRGDVTRGRRGARQPDGPVFGGNMISGWGLIDVKGADEMQKAARLLRRFSRELDAVAEGVLNLAWPPDLLDRLQQEGAERHPRLRFVTGPDHLPTESQTPARALRQAADGSPVGVLRGEPRSWYGNDEITALMRNLNATLAERGSGMHWQNALPLLPMTLEQVMEAAGCAPDSEAGRVQEARWRDAQALRAELTALTDAMRRANAARRAGAPPAMVGFANEPDEQEEMTFGEEVTAIAQEMMAAPWPPGVTPPADVFEAVNRAMHWVEREHWGADEREAELIATTLAPLAPLLERMWDAALRGAALAEAPRFWRDDEGGRHDR